MIPTKWIPLALFLLLVPFSAARADEYDTTINVFRNAGESGGFFSSAVGYAVFLTIGKGGLGIGGAHGSGRIYKHGKHVGDTSMTQITIGFQLGGQAFSQIIFFQDDRAFREFTSGNFEFGAQAQAVGITAGASAAATTTGASTTTSTSTENAKTSSAGYHKGMAIFTVAKGGLMYEASVGGQKFSYKPR